MQNIEDLILKKIIRESGLPLKVFANATGLSSQNVLNWWGGNKRVTINGKNINNFENYFGLSISDTNDETTKLIRQRMYGDFSYLPHKYSMNANSKARSSFYIIKYLELLNGKMFVDNLLSSMSVHPRFFENLNRDINILFFNDLLRKCEDMGFDSNNFKQVAQSMFLSIEHSEFEKTICRCNEYEDLYTQFSKIINAFDTNFSYDFFISKNGADLVTRLKPDLKKMITENKITIDHVFAYRPLLFSQLPALSGLPTLDVQVKSCILRGDEFSRFQVRFPVERLSRINIGS